MRHAERAARALAALLLFTVAAAGAPAPDAAPDASAPVRIGYFHGGRTNMIYRAYVHGCFDAAGANVRLFSKKLHAREFEPLAPDAWLESGMGEAKVSGVQLVDKIASGEFDGGTIGEASFLDAVKRGLPIVAVALLGHQTKGRPGHAIILRRGVTITTPADFKSKTLISRRAGPMDEALLRAFVISLGLDPDKDVHILSQVNEDDSVALLASGKADGGFYHLLLGKLVVQRGLGRIYRPMDWANPEILQALLVFNAQFAKDHPEKVQSVVDGYVARIAYEHSLPEAKRDRSGMTGMMMEEDFRGLSIPTYDDVPRVRPELLREAQALLTSAGGLKGDVDLAPAINQSFVAASAAKLKAGALPLACRPHARTPFRNVLLLGWDGARRGRVKELLALKKLPNLQRLIDDGRWLDTQVTTGATDTKAGWTQILTGYDPEVTGVYDNRLRYGAIPEGDTVPERLKAAFGPEIRTVFLAGKRGNLGTRGPHKICANCERGVYRDEKLFAHSLVPPEKRDIREFAAEPYHVTARKVDDFENGLGAMDHVGSAILDRLGQLRDGRFFLFAEFEEPDEEGHRYHEDSPEYRDALLGLDAWLGRIRERLAELKLDRQTLIYLTTDHGFKPGGKGHRDQPRTFLVTNDPAVSRSIGDRRDTAATILDRFGIDPSRANPPLNGRSLLDP